MRAGGMLSGWRRDISVIPGRPYATYSRTYPEDEWKNKCIEYLDEARETARTHRPAKVLVYVRFMGSRQRRLAATIIAS